MAGRPPPPDAMKIGDDDAPEGQIAYFWHRLGPRLRWSWEGARAVYAEAYSMRCWVWAQGASIAVSLALPLGASERALIWALGFLVIASELMNSAVEHAVDLAQPEIDPIAKIAKDAASAAVAVTALAAAAAWLALLAGLLL